MAKYTFKQFQAEYPDDASCLAELMRDELRRDRNYLPGLRRR